MDCALLTVPAEEARHAFGPASSGLYPARASRPIVRSGWVTGSEPRPKTKDRSNAMAELVRETASGLHPVSSCGCGR